MLAEDYSVAKTCQNFIQLLFIHTKLYRKTFLPLLGGFFTLIAKPAVIFYHLSPDEVGTSEKEIKMFLGEHYYVTNLQSTL